MRIRTVGMVDVRRRPGGLTFECGVTVVVVEKRNG